MQYDLLFNPTDEHRMIREMVAEFTRNEVEPQAAKHDALGTLNTELFRKLGMRHLCVVDNQGILVGIVTRKDLMTFSLEDNIRRCV